MLNFDNLCLVSPYCFDIEEKRLENRVANLRYASKAAAKTLSVAAPTLKFFYMPQIDSDPIFKGGYNNLQSDILAINLGGFTSLNDELYGKLLTDGLAPDFYTDTVVMANGIRRKWQLNQGKKYDPTEATQWGGNFARDWLEKHPEYQNAHLTTPFVANLIVF